MTEAEWHVSIDPLAMLSLARSRSLSIVRVPASDRKLVLCACACYRQIWHELDEGSKNQVERVEEHADEDGLYLLFPVVEEADVGEWEAADDLDATNDPENRVWNHVAVRLREVIRRIESIEAKRYFHNPGGLHVRFVMDSRLATICDLLRDICGNPYRPYPSPPSWPLPVVKLAESLYAGEDCSFALHDALLEAGHPELAEHFAKEQGHPKGCWVVDMILGKS